MANITGTNGNDTLTGTTADDIIQGLDGNDRIIISTGQDSIDGGAGNDTVDLRSIETGVSLTLSAGGGFLTTGRPTGNPNEIVVFSTLDHIENIVGNSKYSNSIDPGRFESGQMDIDLSINRVTYTPPSGVTSTFTIKNFDNINGAGGDNRLAGNNRNNQIFGGLGNDVVIGSKGNDNLNGFNSLTSNLFTNDINTLDYSNLGHAVKVSLNQRIVRIGLSPYFSLIQDGTTDKGSFGKDTIANFDKIIGANNKVNTLDLSTSVDGASVDINLANNSLNTNLNISPIQGLPTTFKYEVVNFTNAIGSKGNDTIVGANRNSKLTGGGGSDIITGGSKNDIITGSDSTNRGVDEIDTLTGGGGRDKFILVDKNGAYYISNGSNDYALITDFNLFQDSISIGNCKDYSFAIEGGNTIDLFSGKDANTRDLIAKIQITGGISSSSSSRSIAGSTLNIDSIVSKIDILSGSDATADA
jgi:Ca2+-binding RTX toxin-like protein